MVVVGFFRVISVEKFALIIKVLQKKLEKRQFLIPFYRLFRFEFPIQDIVAL